jgi:hypothetical protein
MRTDAPHSSGSVVTVKTSPQRLDAAIS